MRVRTIKGVLAELGGREEILAAITDALTKLNRGERYSHALAGMVLPECWSDEQGDWVDYTPWFDLRHKLAKEYGIRSTLRRMEYPGYPEEWYQKLDATD